MNTENTENTESTASFWHFSVQHYARPGVAEACLKLQDDYDLDVNLVLLCLWYGQHFGELSSGQFEQVLAFSDNWSGNVVKPLRQSRRWIKQYRTASEMDPEVLEKFREKVKQLELNAEKLQQEQLQQLVVTAAPSQGQVQNNCADTAMKNLDAYLSRSGVEKNTVPGRLLNVVTTGL